MPATSRSGGDRKSVGHDGTKQDGVPVRPTGRGSDFNKKWSELVSQMDKKALRKIDCHQLSILAELLCHADLLAKMLQEDPLDEKSRRFYLQTAQQISRLSAQFGLSPSDRMRLKLEPDEPEDDFTKWRSGTTACTGDNLT